MSLISKIIADRFRDKSFDIAKEDYKFMKIKNAKEEIKRQYPDKELIDMPPEQILLLSKYNE